MSLYCSVCKHPVTEGNNQCYPCKAGFGPQLACATCNRLIPRGVATCAMCERAGAKIQDRSTELAVGPAMPSMPNLPPLALSIVAPNSAPPVLPGLPSHVGLAVVSENYNAGRFGVTATVQRPALDVEILNEMGQVVVVAHTVASRISASLMGAAKRGTEISTETSLMVSSGQPTGPSVGEIITEMGQLALILHRLAVRMTHFQGFTETTTLLIKDIRLLATDLQGEIESWRMTQVWKLTDDLKRVIRQCRVVAADLQGERESRLGPQG
jgi:hypothetical protein